MTSLRERVIAIICEKWPNSGNDRSGCSPEAVPLDSDRWG
jgi:hypothetical protein